MDKETKENIEHQISFLKDKTEARLVNLDILISNQISSTGIYMALIIGISFPVYLTFGFKNFIISFAFFFLSWLVPSILRKIKILKERDRIFKIGSLIKGIYKHDLKVDVERLEKIINKMPSPNKKDMKEHFTKI